MRSRMRVQVDGRRSAGPAPAGTVSSVIATTAPGRTPLVRIGRRADPTRRQPDAASPGVRAAEGSGVGA